MSAQTESRRLLFLTNLSHYLTALVVFLKGTDKVTLEGKMAFGILFIVISIVIVLGTIFHHRAERYLKHFKAIVFGLEAIVLTAVGYLYLKEGKQALPYACFASAIMFIVAIFIHFNKAAKRAGSSVNH